MAKINIKPSSPEQATKILLTVARINAPERPSVLIRGDPGVGKTTIAAQVCFDLFGKEPIKVEFATMQGPDLRGLADLDTYQDRVVWRKPDFLPRSGKGMLLCDDISSAEPDTLSATYSLFLDRRVDNLIIPSEYLIVATANDSEDGAIAYDLGTALNDRLLQIYVVQTRESFLRHWAPRGLHPAILSVIHQRPDLLNRNKRRIELDLVVSESPRSWERASHILKACLADHGLEEEALVEAAVSGAVGDEGAEEVIMTLKDLQDLGDPRRLLRLDIAADKPKIRSVLPTTVRGGVALAYALSAIAQTEAEIKKAVAIMTMYSEMDGPALQQTRNGHYPMSGAQIASLGVERLYHKASQISDELAVRIASDPGPGHKEILDFLARSGRRRTP